MHQPGSGDYSSPYYSHPPYAGDYSAPAPPIYPSASGQIPATYPSASASASAPPYSPYPTDFAAGAAYYPAYPPEQPPPPPPPAAPPQSYFPYESPPAPPLPAASVSYPPNPTPSAYPSFDPPPYDTSAARFDQKSSYLGEGLSKYAGGGGAYGQSASAPGYDQDLYGRAAAGGGYRYEGLDEGVYAYDGGRGRAEPYGARGTAPTRSGAALFDDYGRSISMPGGGKERDGGGGGGGGAPAAKIVRAVPKADLSEDVKNGVQKFRVKLLPEGAGSPMDVLCQVGLDGIRMLDPNTSRTLRIYPLETVTRWEVLDSSIFAFWSKSSVDLEPRRIRLKSSSYTTSTILDTVTAATVQFKEIGASSITRSKANPDTGKSSEQQNEKKKGLIDWRNLIKPVNEEKDHWVPDEAVNKCTGCASDFNAFNRRHHCRNCGDIFCDKCTQGRTPLTADADAQPVRVCDRCMAEVSQRLNNAKEAANRPVVHSHEDLAKKLQEAMDINRKSSSASRSSDGSGRRMREVACPICTVHLQVQVPTSGSETIECGVCQHPFLVSSH